jgi:hypothetical protein
MDQACSHIEIPRAFKGAVICDSAGTLSAREIPLRPPSKRRSQPQCIASQYVLVMFLRNDLLECSKLRADLGRWVIRPKENAIVPDLTQDDPDPVWTIVRDQLVHDPRAFEMDIVIDQPRHVVKVEDAAESGRFSFA